MKLTVPCDVLAAALTVAQRGLPAKPVVPVMAGLLLTAHPEADSGGLLRVDGFDYDIHAHASCPARVAEPGRVLVPGRLLADIVRAVRGQVTLATDGPRLAITAGPSRFVVQQLPVDEFPALPPRPEAVGAVGAKEFGQALAQVAIAAGSDDTIPVLTGVHIELDPDSEQVTFAATDRYRFAVRTLPLALYRADLPATTALVPARALSDTAKTLTAGDDLAFALTDKDGGDGGVVSLAAESGAVTVRQLGGDFPKFRALFPTEFATQATVDRAALLAAVKRVALVAERNTPVRLRFTKDRLVLEAGSGDDAQASEHLEAALAGEDITVAFNPRYLADGLDTVDSPTAHFGFTTPTKPAILRGAPAPDADPDDAHQYLIMPVRIS